MDASKYSTVHSRGSPRIKNHLARMFIVPRLRNCFKYPIESWRLEDREGLRVS